MSEILKRLLGAILGLAFLALGLDPNRGVIYFSLPIFFMIPMRYKFPTIAMWFFIVFVVGSLIGEFGFNHFNTFLIYPEIAAIVFLFLTPNYIRARKEIAEMTFTTSFASKQNEFNILKIEAEGLKKENNQIEKQLRQIEHLYDVIKEAGSTLNVQEMIELAKEFTERMFDLPHFIIAALTNDGRKFEVQISSGCDDIFLKSLEIDLESDEIGSVLAREKKPVWFSSFSEDSRFSKLVHYSIRAFLFLPFLVQDRVIGFLCSYSLNNDFLDGEKFSNLQVFCNQISIGLQKSMLYERVQKLSITDGLTKLYSYRYFKQRLEEELILANRYSSQLSLLILDIDHFKHYNDTFGHVAGDHVLMEVAKILKEQSDITHLAARYGGEEMVLVASETTKEQAMDLAEKIREKIESHSVAVGKETTNVTVSIGVATFPQDSQTNLDLIAKADKALYAAKSRGRNRIVAYPI